MFDTTNPREQKFPQTRHLQQFHNGKTLKIYLEALNHPVIIDRTIGSIEV
jgi:hypothetical protein